MFTSMRFKTPVIDDALYSNMDAMLKDKLLDLFKYAMRSVAATLARAAQFDTSDFANTGASGCDGFTLAIRQIFPGELEAWIGVFENGEQQLEVIGHLE
ncbi:hypothetical protein [Ralstonia solanacearum]|uniref:hypothetical protein n=1 Tax=Ralstonia solanacearum TaxID=305 RepID=UPI0018D05283|nr:hypothetical protein [Ralstonia solanacearum]